MIGMIIFLAVGNLFKTHSEITRDNIINSSLKLTNSFISSVIITETATCKECDYVSIDLKTGEDIGGYFTEIKLDDGLNVTASQQTFSSSIHNIKESVDITPGKTSSTKTITLTFDRTKNKLMIR
jgi:C4-type Zn-finger protein